MTILEQILAGLQQKFTGGGHCYSYPNCHQKGRGGNGRDKGKLHRRGYQFFGRA